MESWKGGRVRGKGTGRGWGRKVDRGTGSIGMANRKRRGSRHRYREWQRRGGGKRYRCDYEPHESLGAKVAWNDNDVETWRGPETRSRDEH